LTNLDPGLPTPGTVYDLTVPKGLRRLKHDPALLCQHVEFTDRSPLNVVIFATGWGDGVYPLALGYDEKDRIAAVITYTYVVPWRLSGLPGSPPPPVLEREAKRGG
jgi:hypothetical protein